jgi:class 3 adenylate cyclase
MDTKGSELTEIMKEQEQETAPSKDGDVGVRSIQFVRIEHDQERDGDSVEDDMTVDHDGSSHASSDGTNNHISGTMGGVDHRRLRKCLINSFIMVIITVPVLIYLAARSAQTDAFENDYKSLSEQVVDAFESNVGSLLIGLDSVGVLATSHALDSNSTWPFVTLYDFDYVGASALALTDTPGISLNPFVKPDQREAWERYSLENIGWLLQALARAPAPPTSESARSLAEQAARNLLSAPDFSLGFSQQIYEIVPNVENPVIVDDSDGPYLPSWQSVPVDPVMINFNLNSNVVEREQIRHTFASAHALISPTENLTLYDPIIADHRVARYTRWLQQLTGDLNRTYAGEPVSSVFYPVFDTFDKNREVVAILSSNVLWERFFTGILPPSSKGVVCVVENSCGGIFTYRFDGESTEFLGLEDHHDTKYDEYEVVYELASARQESEKFKFSQTVPPLDEDFCPFSLRIYPSADLQDEHMTPAPVITTICVAVFLLFLGFVANSYDWMVRRRTRRILKSEKQAHAVVASHFPHLVRDRLFTSNRKTNRAPMMAHPRARIKNYLDTSPGEGANKKDDISFLHEAPIADLFLHCTVLFADISGFSPWSSEREPEQVFTLLETIFQAFDRLAKKHGVFKVETIGDSYVAVTGLPEPQSDHALRMTRFARDALTRANKVTRFLETALGPGTADLQFRFGLHSGQVTAGVLMGEKTRFQLFGDTVNTASRMESTGQGNRIQISESTALLLFDGGKEDWIQLRSDPVNVKGKGVVKTYWAIHRVSDDMLQSRASVVSISRSDSTILDEEDDIATGFTDEKDLWAAKDGEGGQIAMPKASKVSKNQRLVSWLKDLMTIYLKKVVAQRQSRALLKFRLATADPESKLQKGEMVLDEVVDAFIMPKFDWKKNNRAVDPESIELPPEVTSQLHDFIEAISSQYRDNPFHNFEHASHVTMSAVKVSGMSQCHVNNLITCLTLPP